METMLPILDRFLTACTSNDGNGKVQYMNLYNLYNSWSRNQNSAKLNKIQLEKAMIQKGYSKRKSYDGKCKKMKMYWFGLMLK